MRRRLRLVFVAVGLACGGLLVGCGEDGGAGADATATVASVAAATPAATKDAGTRVLLEGSVTLDGVPLEAEFLGVQVRRDGLLASCQDEIVAPIFGRYAVGVYSEDELGGCGAPGAELILWTYAADRQLYSLERAPWPGDGVAATFDAAFSTADPDGAIGPTTEARGRVMTASGAAADIGAIIEATIDGVTCGRTTVRDFSTPEEEYVGYGIAVVGPESVPGCVAGGTVTFSVDGTPTGEMMVHDLGVGAGGHEVDLTVPQSAQPW